MVEATLKRWLEASNPSVLISNEAQISRKCLNSISMNLQSKLFMPLEKWFQREKQMLKVQSQFDYCLDLTANANSALRTAPKP